MPEEKAEFSKTRFPMIRCECGAEFLLIPDVAEMSRTVEKHAQSHKENVKNPIEAEAVFARIRDHLIEQILQKAVEYSSSRNNEDS